MISEVDRETHRSAVVVETSQGRKSQDPKEDDLSGSTAMWATFKTLLTFHYTDWLIRILIMAYYNPNITG